MVGLWPVTSSIVLASLWIGSGCFFFEIFHHSFVGRKYDRWGRRRSATVCETDLRKVAPAAKIGVVLDGMDGGGELSFLLKCFKCSVLWKLWYVFRCRYCAEKDTVAVAKTSDS